MLRALPSVLLMGCSSDRVEKIVKLRLRVYPSEGSTTDFSGEGMNKLEAALGCTGFNPQWTSPATISSDPIPTASVVSPASTIAFTPDYSKYLLKPVTHTHVLNSIFLSNPTIFHRCVISIQPTHLLYTIILLLQHFNHSLVVD